MKLLFIQSDPFAWTGKMYLSAILKEANHECEILIEPAEKDLITSIKNVSPDVVAFSPTTGVHHWALDRAREIKKKLNSTILFGGHHVTYYPQVIEHDFIDIVCIGESEQAILELFDKLKRKEDITNIKNLWVKKNGKVYKNDTRPLFDDLDSLPFPDRSLYYDRYDFLRNQKSREFIFQRGCPYKCSFCYAHALKNLYSGKGKYTRYKSVDRVINELLDVKEKWGMESAMIFDEVMLSKKEWLFEFLIKFKEKVNISMVLESRANLIDDEETVIRLKEAGCKCIRMGVETGTDYLRNTVLKKNLSNKTIEKSAALLRKHGILLETYNMIGLPRETLKDAFETLTFNIKIKADYAWCCIFQPYPKTDLTELAIADGFIPKDFFDDLEPSFFISSPMKIEHKNEIVNLQKFFALAVKFPFLLPLVKLLIKFPSNKIYNLIFMMFYVYMTLITTEIGIRGLYKLGKLTGNYWKKKPSKSFSPSKSVPKLDPSHGEML